MASMPFYSKGASGGLDPSKIEFLGGKIVRNKLRFLGYLDNLQF